MFTVRRKKITTFVDILTDMQKWFVPMWQVNFTCSTMQWISLFVSRKERNQSVRVPGLFLEPDSTWKSW